MSKDTKLQGYANMVISIDTVISSLSFKWLIVSSDSIFLLKISVTVLNVKKQPMTKKNTEKAIPVIEASLMLSGIYLIMSS